MNRKTEYTYDISGRLLRTFQPGFSDISSSYDVMNRVTGTWYTFAGQTKTASFSYGKDGLKGTSTLISGARRSSVYDSLNRETSTTVGSLSRSVSYLNVSGSRTTTLPSGVNYAQGGTTLLNTAYTYDNNGNISTMTVDSVTYTYTYDAKNQLTAVTDGTNTASYSYDNGGNITSKTVNGVTTAYGYGDTNWKDKLTSYDGQSITYDAIGNPLSYRGMTMSWTGRQLNSITSNGTTSSYLYNADGIRTRKTVGDVTTDYFLNGSTILAEKTGSSVIWYIYDSDGEILGFTYNGTPYYYIKNVQGDVYRVVNASGSVVASYTYDAWGKVLSATGSMANINPIRYRSYYYDAETSLYYLQNRYYDPETGRFLNADGLLGANQDLLSYNLFAYCSNNPIVFSDPTGCVIKEAAAILIVSATIGALAILSGLGVAGAQTAQQQLQGKLDRAWNTRINAAQELIGYPSATISRAAERDQEIAISSPPDSEYNYWAATRVGSNIAITTPLTVEQAAARVALGKSVMCRNQVAALHIVFINGYVNAVGPERGTREGFYWHYHPTRNHTGYDSIHIWFYGEPIDKKLSTH